MRTSGRVSAYKGRWGYRDWADGVASAWHFAGNVSAWRLIVHSLLASVLLVLLYGTYCLHSVMTKELYKRTSSQEIAEERFDELTNPIHARLYELERIVEEHDAHKVFILYRVYKGTPIQTSLMRGANR